ncbi:EamA family transporter [Methylobacterium indicum]|uniref:EamA domain-containing protein n=1 Tax=Methylobacterium indicum TaxID=1775910 RepID=A0A8H8WWM6_9HYPH|nr:EamA family transporter [Methylobacterium indicum]BCM85915.1 hypothetical protein mvi_43760 [Methylobacterium indicum]
MTPLVLAGVTLAAILHAGWNAVLRGGSDRLWSMTLMMIAVGGTSAAALPFLPWPAPASWPYIVASAVIHAAYNLSLVRAYRSGELGQIYPVSRGSSPVLVALGAAAFAQERLTVPAVIGIALVSGGILSLALQGARPRDGQRKGGFLPAALVTGALIGAYTVVDGIGVRLAGNSLAYANSMFLLWSVTTPVIYLFGRQRPPAYTRGQTMAALGGGLVSIVAYGIVIAAMQSGAMGVVSALRETSVVYAALIGRLFLNERLTARRIAACLAIAGGAACLAYPAG